MSKVADHPFAAVVERPASTLVRSHTLQVARFQGWIASSEDTGAHVQVTVGDGEPYHLPALLPRPDVLDVLGREAGLRIAHGFSFFVDLPPGLAEPLPVLLQASDGRRVFQFPRYLVDSQVDLTCLDTFLGDPPILREMAGRNLRGRGLEFGALHLPLALDGGVTRMAYADRRTRQESLETYPEMREQFGESMVEVDFVIDLDGSDLTELAPHAFDFFVANGVLEHLANPLLFLDRLGRIMKPGARFLLTIPDRDFAFDTFRALTPMEHLVAEYRARISHVSDAHIRDALRHILPAIPEDPATQRALLDAHRERSVHVHVWDQRSMDEFLRIATEALPLPFRIIDRATSRHADGNCIYVLEKIS